MQCCLSRVFRNFEARQFIPSTPITALQMKSMEYALHFHSGPSVFEHHWSCATYLSWFWIQAGLPRSLQLWLKWWHNARRLPGFRATWVSHAYVSRYACTLCKWLYRNHCAEGKEKLAGVMRPMHGFSIIPQSGWIDFDPTNNLVHPSAHYHRMGKRLFWSSTIKRRHPEYRKASLDVFCRCKEIRLGSVNGQMGNRQ